jgi:hypothetical protein
VSQHDFLGQWWQYLVAGVSTVGVAVGSHLRVRDRVKTLEVKQSVIESKAEMLEDTHETCIRLESRMTLLESDLRASGEAFTRDMRAQAKTQEQVLDTLGKIERAFKIE